MSRPSAPRKSTRRANTFVGLHTRLSDAWKSLDAASEQRRDEWQRPAGDVLSGQRPPVAHRERRDLRSRRRRVQRRQRRETSGRGERAPHGTRRPAVSRHGHELRGASGESLRADVACQRAAVHRARRRDLVVRRRVRPDAGLSLRRGRARPGTRPRAPPVHPPGPRAYPLLKEACDKYFYLPHRGETRGIGGLFADDLNDTTPEIGGNFEHCFALIRRIGDAYLETYTQHRAAPRRPRRSARASRIFSACAAGATWNSTWRSIAARASDCSRGAHRIAAHVDAAARRVALRLSPAPGSPEARLAEYLKPRDWLGAHEIRRAAGQFRHTGVARDARRARVPRRACSAIRAWSSCRACCGCRSCTASSCACGRAPARRNTPPSGRPQGSPLAVQSEALRAGSKTALRPRTDPGGAGHALHRRRDGAAGHRIRCAPRARRKSSSMPMFPQYCGATTGAVFDQVSAALRAHAASCPRCISCRTITMTPAYIEALAASVQEHRREFGVDCATCSCRFTACRSDSWRREIPIARSANAPRVCWRSGSASAPDAWSVSFQSRFGRARWLQPYTSEVLAGMPRARRSRA